MNSKKINRTNWIYIGLITLIWFVVYILAQIFLEQKLGWDEVNYMSTAKGIAADFDFSSRTYTIMGLIKHGYPSSLINFPIFSIYLAGFFKLFGASLKVAYFSTWLCALGVCILIYLIFLLLSENNRKLAFCTSISYLFFPGILKTCDSAMMEQMGCLLLCLAVYLILKDYVKGTFNYITVLKFSLSFLIIWLYKSLFVGFFFGALIFILFAYNSKISGKKLNTKIPLFLFVTLSYGIFAVLFYILKKFVFLPVAPMMSFSPALEYSQVYADFLGGFLNNFLQNAINNIITFFVYAVAPYFIYPIAYTHPSSQVFVFVPHVIYLAMYFFLTFITIVLTFAYWKKLKPEVKLFVGLTLGTIISFNLIFNFLFSTTYENMWRYNVYSLPLFLCYIAIIFRTHFEYAKPFALEHPIVIKVIPSFILIFYFLPLSLSLLNTQLVLWNGYHIRAKNNAELVRSFIKDDSPGFIYFNDGLHTTLTDYPIRQVFKDATNEQLLQVNKILPEPIKYLFLKPTDWLFVNNKDLIIKGSLILNNQYETIGFNNEAQVVVYKLRGEKEKIDN